VPSAAISAALQCRPQQTVDGFHAALEIGPRSSYVPNAPIGVHSGSFLPIARRYTHARPELTHG